VSFEPEIPLNDRHLERPLMQRVTSFGLQTTLEMAANP